MNHAQPYFLSEETALVIKLQAEIIIYTWLLKPKNRTNLCDEAFPLAFLKCFILLLLFVCGEILLELPLSTGDAGWVSLIRLMKIVASMMSQNNHLQSDHYKSKHFLAGYLSHGLIWRSRFLLVQHLLVR